MTSDEFKNKVIPVGNKLFQFARMLLRDEDEARDAVQETYLKLWGLKEELSGIKNMEAFAVKITKNWCLDRMKAKKPVLIDSYSGRYDKREESDNPYKKLELADNMKRYLDLTGGLPEQQRIIIHLRDVQGLEFDEIAEATGMTVNNIRVNLSRARTKIRENLVKSDNYGQERSRHSSP